MEMNEMHQKIHWLKRAIILSYVLFFSCLIVSFAIIDKKLSQYEVSISVLENTIQQQRSYMNWRLDLVSAESKSYASSAALYSKYGDGEWLLKRAKDSSKELFDAISMKPEQQIGKGNSDERN